MDRRDYILRVIEQFGQIALALRQLILGGRAGSAGVKEQLRSVAQHAGLDLDTARVVSVDTLTGLLAPGGELEPGRCWMCAETLYLDGLAARLDGDLERARDSYGKARLLFSMVAPFGAFLVGFPEAAERVAEIDAKLSELADQDDDGPGPGGGQQPRRLAGGRPRRAA